MNAQQEKIKDTKLVIIEAAIELFAKNGYGGTSVRDIASAADVNLAAINYHFKNKENLYWRVFDFNYDWMKAGIEKLGEKDTDTAQLTVDVFRFFIEGGNALMNTFKIFLNDQINAPDENIPKGGDERFGPPGQEVFLRKIRMDVGDMIPEESVYWAMKMIFGSLVHYGVVSSTSVMKERCKFDESLNPESIENALRHSVKAHLTYLGANPRLV